MGCLFMKHRRELRLEEQLIQEVEEVQQPDQSGSEESYESVQIADVDNSIIVTERDHVIYRWLQRQDDQQRQSRANRQEKSPFILDESSSSAHSKSPKSSLSSST